MLFNGLPQFKLRVAAQSKGVIVLSGPVHGVLN